MNDQPTSMEPETVLDVRGLTMHFRTRNGWVRATDDVSFTLARGETIGLVGESGCGKSSTAMSLVRLLPSNAEIKEGEVWLNGRDVLKLSPEQLRATRWNEAAVIFQGAMNALDPVRRVGAQLVDALLLHEPSVGQAAARKRVEELFAMVGLAAERLDAFPHQFSGGMRQRAMIALALVADPDLIIADEPTTALDVVTQDQILREINALQKRLQKAMVLISHDMAVIAETCDKVAVLYAGEVVEIGETAQVINDPRHPYTIGLLRSYPNLYGERRALASIPGELPDLAQLPSGCRFRDRCPLAQARCAEARPALEVHPGQDHAVRCHFADQFDPDALVFGGI